MSLCCRPRSWGAATRRQSPGGWSRSGIRSPVFWKGAGRPGAVEEVRVEHEAETRRMWLPKGKRTMLYVDREKASRSFFGALSLT